MDDGEGIDRALERQGAKKFALFLGELLARITDGRERHVVEVLDFAAFGGLLVMVAFDDGAAKRADNLEAFAGVRIVADDIANADSMGDCLGLHVLQYGLEGLEVTVDVSKYTKSHAYRSDYASGMLNPKETMLIGKDSFFFWDGKFLLQPTDFFFDPVALVLFHLPFFGGKALP